MTDRVMTAIYTQACMAVWQTQTISAPVEKTISTGPGTFS